MLFNLYCVCVCVSECVSECVCVFGTSALVVCKARSLAFSLDNPATIDTLVDGSVSRATDAAQAGPFDPYKRLLLAIPSLFDGSGCTSLLVALQVGPACILPRPRT